MEVQELVQCPGCKGQYQKGELEEFGGLCCSCNDEREAQYQEECDNEAPLDDED